MPTVYFNVSSGCGTTRLSLNLDKEKGSFTGTYYSYWMLDAKATELDFGGAASTLAPAVWRLQLSEEFGDMFLYTLGSDISFVDSESEYAHIMMSCQGSVNHDNTTYNAILTTDSLEAKTEELKSLKDKRVFKCVFKQE